METSGSSTESQAQCLKSNTNSNLFALKTSIFLLLYRYCYQVWICGWGNSLVERELEKLLFGLVFLLLTYCIYQSKNRG